MQIAQKENVKILKIKNLDYPWQVFYLLLRGPCRQRDETGEAIEVRVPQDGHHRLSCHPRRSRPQLQMEVSQIGKVWTVLLQKLNEDLKKMK